MAHTWINVGVIRFWVRSEKRAVAGAGVEDWRSRLRRQRIVVEGRAGVNKSATRMPSRSAMVLRRWKLNVNRLCSTFDSVETGM